MVNDINYKKLLYITECLSYGLDSVDVRTAVGDALLDLLDADYYASYVWNSVDRKFSQGVSINMDEKNLERYNDYYQFHDPITHKLQKRQVTTRVTDVMPQDEFTKTEFYNNFLAHDGLYWGVNLYAYDNKENIGDIRIWRNKKKQNFDQTSVRLLEMIRPHFTNSLRTMRRLEDNNNVPSFSEPTITASWDTQLIAQLFGFTAREAEIVRELLRGKKDDEIAQQLCIAYSTLRTHIKHIYTKTDVHNRSSLCHRVLNQLTGLV